MDLVPKINSLQILPERYFGQKDMSKIVRAFLGAIGMDGSLSLEKLV